MYLVSGWSEARGLALKSMRRALCHHFRHPNEIPIPDLHPTPLHLLLHGLCSRVVRSRWRCSQPVWEQNMGQLGGDPNQFARFILGYRPVKTKQHQVVNFSRHCIFQRVNFAGVLRGLGGKWAGTGTDPYCCPWVGSSFGHAKWARCHVVA